MDISNFKGHSKKALEALSQRIPYTFVQPMFLHDALCHPSVGGENFQRLEFLGDRVLGLVMAHWLYELFPHDTEGTLAKRYAACVQRQTLQTVAQQWQLASVLRYSLMETAIAVKQASGRQPSRVLADACEAILGAIYLDGGLEQARQVIHTWWLPYVSSTVPVDPKTDLQEYEQARGGSTPVYQSLCQTGPSHAPWFQVQVILSSDVSFVGEGPSKKEAQKNAAMAALRALQEKATQ